jgi:hypothetical protein
LPALGVTVIHCVPPGETAVVNATLPLLAFAETVCAAGSAAPSIQVKEIDVGVAVNVGVVVCAIAQPASASKRGKRKLMLPHIVPDRPIRAAENPYALKTHGGAGLHRAAGFQPAVFHGAPALATLANRRAAYKAAPRSQDLRRARFKGAPPACAHGLCVARWSISVVQFPKVFDRSRGTAHRRYSS